MKSKKGFTLIELLAVIVILAVIALIATPLIMNVINDARKNAAIDSGYGYLKAVENAMVSKMYEDTTVAFNNGKIAPGTGDVVAYTETVTSGTATPINLTVTYSGSKASFTEIAVTNGSISGVTGLSVNGYKLTYDATSGKLSAE